MRDKDTIKKRTRKLLRINRCGHSERRLYDNLDGTYTVLFETYNYEDQTYFSSYEVNYNQFSDALKGVNYGALH